jgi:uncharacterized membrane protein
MKKSVFLALPVLLINTTLYACPSCNKELNDAIYNDSFYTYLLQALTAFGALLVITTLLLILYKKANAHPGQKDPSPVPMVCASVILGIGLGGLADGIVLHQILQWHELFSNQISPSDYIGKSVNMFWDGIFHAFCFAVIVAGVVLLWKLSAREHITKSGKLFTGGLLSGWGLFNVVEGLINHHLLKLHHVIQNSPHRDFADLVFLLVSVVMMIIGYRLIKTGRTKVRTFFFINHLNF